MSKKELGICGAIAVITVVLCIATAGGQEQAAPVVSTDPLNQGTALEVRLAAILSDIEGAGNVKALITQDEDGATIGAVIISPGADSPEIRIKLQLATCTALGIEASQIRIFKGQ